MPVFRVNSRYTLPAGGQFCCIILWHSMAHTQVISRGNAEVMMSSTGQHCFLLTEGALVLLKRELIALSCLDHAPGHVRCAVSTH